MIDRLLRPFQDAYNCLLLKKQRIKHGKNLKIRGCIYAMGRIQIGDNVSINSGTKFNPIGGQNRTLLVTHSTGKIVIGNNVGISNSALVSMDSIIIEDDVKIGGNVKIYDNDFHSLKYERRIQNLDTDIAHRPVCIKKGAFIGSHSIVLKGVTIGEKSIVGAGSVVTRDIPNGEIWAGNPAKYIKKIEL